MQVADCTVRALAIVTKAPYDICYDALKDAGRRSHDGFDLSGYLRNSLPFYGWTAAYLKAPRTMTLDALFAGEPRGRLIVELSTHVMAVIDGIAYDMIRLPSDCRVYGVWTFRRVGAK